MKAPCFVAATFIPQSKPPPEKPAVRFIPSVAKKVLAIQRAADQISKAGFDESEHPRFPRGDARGGEFAPKGETGNAGSGSKDSQPDESKAKKIPLETEHVSVLSDSPLNLTPKEYAKIAIDKLAPLKTETDSVLSDAAKIAGVKLINPPAKKAEKLAGNISKAISKLTNPSPETVRQAANGQANDVLRYTFILSEKQYGDELESAMETMRKAGFKVALKMGSENYKNAWTTTRYKGINAVFAWKGAPVEVQFHTEASFSAKEKAHAWYDEANTLPEGSPRRAGLEKQIADVMAAVPIATGHERFNHLIKDWNRR